MNIGIDFGGVLSIHDAGNKAHINTNIDMPDAIESLYQLREMSNKLFLISFCGKNRAIETKKSIDELGDLFEDQYYTKKKEWKGYVCQHLNIDIMIDDNQEVLDDVKKISPDTHCILFTDWKNVINKIFTLEKSKDDIKNYITSELKIDRYLHHF